MKDNDKIIVRKMTEFKMTEDDDWRYISVFQPPHCQESRYPEEMCIVKMSGKRNC